MMRFILLFKKFKSNIVHHWGNTSENFRECRNEFWFIVFNLKSDLDNAEEKIDYLTDTINDLQDEIEMLKDYLH